MNFKLQIQTEQNICSYKHKSEFKRNLEMNYTVSILYKTLYLIITGHSYIVTA